ncbi:hypothetical protein [Helicobacter trogontum]|uniref:Uncharacterized protein n=1 Tax=Helicobacter trogontum TaxID=50960 RepID=A0A4U8SDM9_9HELI|nr:hypothetical protein [Helicobacter trogontum]TLD84249.1 hypothetical protein LS81_001935 [Helicobacter trogontum]
MKTYIGIKAIQAEPMEKNGKEGYKVIYKDGYESWSPKEVFEEAYYECDNAKELEEMWNNNQNDVLRAIAGWACIEQ